ncbi:MAG: hypothetical protein WCK35_23125 [Chloroflexota bacterium]
MNDLNTEVTSDDKLWALLAWIIPIIAIVLLLMEDKKNRPFLKYHSVHSLAVTVVLSIVSVVTFGCGGVLFLVMIWWGIKAYQGEYVVIPMLTDFVKKQGWC